MGSAVFFILLALGTNLGYNNKENKDKKENK